MDVLVFTFFTAVILYFLLRILFRRLRFIKRKALWSAIAALILSPVVYVLVVMAVFSTEYYYEKQGFDPVVWQQKVEERFRMSEDIVESKMLIGKTREEVIEILGPGYSDYTPSHIGYYLGYKPALFNIDPDYLDIYFENGRVVRVVQHGS